MSGDLTLVFIFGGTESIHDRLKSSGLGKVDLRFFAEDCEILESFAREEPQCIVSFGSVHGYAKLNSSPLYIRKRWIHFENEKNEEEVINSALRCAMHAALGPSKLPKISVITPTFRTGERIMRPYRSLLSQKYADWEWLIMDDSDDDGETWNLINSIAKKDHRVSVYKQGKHTGRIGEVKGKLGGLASGQLILELDHDDELTDDAMYSVIGAFSRFPEAGFAYSDWAEVFEDGRNASYGDSWAFGYGKSYGDVRNGKTYLVHSAPNVNPKTIRHIVSVPNHVRVWKKDLYDSIGGHNRLLHVADDYELCVRTFLKTRMVHIPRMSYIQYHNSSGNTQRSRSKEIQRLVNSISKHYDKSIHDRFMELGINDFCWNENAGFGDVNTANPDVECHVSLKYNP